MVKNLPSNGGNMGVRLVWEDPTSYGATKPEHQQVTTPDAHVP